jgi:rhodanese-related sulfurtransferase
VLVCDPGRELEAKVRLGRIGFDNVIGSLADPLATLVEHPELAERSSRMTAAELARQRTEVRELTVVDVRNLGELSQGAIPGSVHVPLARLVERMGELDLSRPTVVYCAGGTRSMVASSMLSSAGFTDVSDLLGGYQAWASLAPE